MKIITFLSIAAICGIVLFLTACERDIDGRTEAMRKNDERLYIEEGNRQHDEKKASGENCLKRGGIIVRSSWDGRIVDCK